MATIINNPPGSATRERETVREDDSGAGVVVGIVIALLVLIAFFVFAWPYIRNGSVTPSTNGTNGTPSSVNGTVNVQTTPNGSGGNTPSGGNTGNTPSGSY